MSMPEAIRVACRNLARAGIGFTVIPVVPARGDTHPAPYPPAAGAAARTSAGQWSFPFDLDTRRRIPA